ncbi:hypothetical protein V6N11_020396 [Hibiscus sabdariffa]|uniref:Uncharacterized protein n=1 Tax=Hibiscus sabdariffa TaxID=183260 RepID=A0ABR2Q8S3_9ROSI
MLASLLMLGLTLPPMVLHFCINKARPISQDYPLEQKIQRLLRRRRRKLVADAAIDTVGKQSILSDQDTHGNQNACNNQNALDNQNAATRDDAIQVEKPVLVRDTYIETIPSKEAQVNKDELPVDATTSPNAVASHAKSTKFDKARVLEEIKPTRLATAREHDATTALIQEELLSPLPK